MNSQFPNQVKHSTQFAGYTEAAPMISSHGLSKTFKRRTGEVQAVRGVDLQVFKGEIVGVLGPNGAGKSVTMKMLCTLLNPGGGSASIAGFDLQTEQNEIKRHIGYISQRGSTSDEARAGDEIMWQARLYGIAKSTAHERGLELFRALDLEGQWDKKCGSLSGGQRRRVDIAMGLIHQPALVFMDEPTTGLDPQSRANLWDHITKLRDEYGTTIFLTTHYMDEADALCDRILIIDHGIIVGEGTPKQLRDKIAGDTIKLTLRNNEDASRAAGVAEKLSAAEPVINGNIVQIQVPGGPAALPELIKSLGAKKVEAIAVEMSSPTLDDVFLSLTGRTLRD